MKIGQKRLCTAAVAWGFAMAAQAEPLTLIFAGDIMLDDGPGRVIAAGGDPLAPFAPILEEIGRAHV